MKIFHALIFYLKLLGISKWNFPEPFQNVPITLIQRIVILIAISITFVTSLWFFCYEAIKLSEFADSFCMSLASLLSFVWYLISLWKCNHIETMFNNIQQLVDNRNYFIFGF